MINVIGEDIETSKIASFSFNFELESSYVNSNSGKERVLNFSLPLFEIKLTLATTDIATIAIPMYKKIFFFTLYIFY